MTLRPLALALSLVVASACADSDPDALSLAGEAETNGKADQSGDDCTNFSGFWAGTCEDNLGTVNPSYFAFEQTDCASINTGLSPVAIGGKNTTEWKGTGFKVKRTDQAAWSDEEQTSLVLDLSLIRKVGSATTRIEGTGTLELTRADELVLTTDGILTTPTGQEIPHHQVCTYVLAGAIP